METRLEYALANGGKLEPGVLGPFKALVGWNHLAYKFKLLEELGQDCGGTVNSWYRASQAVMQCRFPYCQKQFDDFLVKLSDIDFKAATYKRGLETLEGQIVKYREHEVLFSEKIALLKRSVCSKEYELGLLRTELKNIKQEKEEADFKIAKFDKFAKDLNEMLESQITDKSKKGIGYNVVPSPHPLILNRPTTLDLSYSGLEEFKEPEVNEYGLRDSSLNSTTGCDKKSDNSKENTNDSLEQHQMTDTETSSFESPLKINKDWKEKFFYPANHVESVNKIEKQVRKNNNAPIIEDWVSDDEDEESHVVKTDIPTAAKIEKPVRKPVRYAEMYSAHKHIAPRAVLMNIGLKSFKTARPVNTVSNSQLNDKGFVDSGCSRHMTGNIAHLSDFKYFDGGYVTFGGGAYRGRITGKGAIKTDNLDFDDLPDENQILLKIPRQDNMYSFDMKNIVPKDSLTCLVAKATSEESMLWHRRLGHINFKNINKLVKENLVRDLPSEGFHQVIDFLSQSHISYALTKKPEIYISFIKQFWRTAEASTDTDGEVTITAIIDGQSKTITEASLRRHLKLEDHDGITSIPNSEIFEQLALIGYQTDSNKLTFQKGVVSPNEVFSNMRRLTKGYTGVEIRLFPTMLTLPTPSSSPTRITSSPSLSSAPSTEPTFEPQPSPDAEYHVPSPNESPLHVVHSHGSDEGSLKLIELMNLVTKLSERIGVLEDDLKRTKKTYSAAFTKLILRIKKLESKVKTGKARKRARVVLSEDEEDDSSKQGRIDEDPNTYFHQDDEVVDDVVHDTAEERQPEDSTAGITVSTAPINISTARETRSTAGRVVYGRRSKEARKDKGKAIMTEPEPEKKSRFFFSMGLEEAIRLQEQVDKEERAQIARDEEIARQLLALDEERVTTETKTTKG
ncbi:ribonuclease H-like domain-containing protein [Tanacetum coccineum]